MKTPQRKLEANKRYRERNREAVLYHKRNNRLRRFGMEPEDLTKMLEAQDYRCAICNDGPLTRDGKTNLSAHIDHCHTCGKVRRVLCKRCNTLVGFIESDFDTFGKAFVYVTDHAIEGHSFAPPLQVDARPFPPEAYRVDRGVSAEEPWPTQGDFERSGINRDELHERRGIDPKGGDVQMLDRVRASLNARAEGRNEGGDSEVMKAVDKIVDKEGWQPKRTRLG